MPTFAELQRSLTDAKHRRTILLKLIEYIDENFLPVGGAESKMRLLDDDNLPVPVEMFEAVAADTLSAEVQQLDQAIQSILASTVSQAAPTPAPVEPAPSVATQVVAPPSEQAPTEPQPPTLEVSQPTAPPQQRRTRRTRQETT